MPADRGDAPARIRIALTGSGGRLGRATREALGLSPAVAEILALDLPIHNLDDPGPGHRLIETMAPHVVIHPAAWTDVDGCARDPELAMRRNGIATGELARVCARIGATLIAVSTNEVFDGRRTDGRPYLPTDEPNPANPYGAAKLAGERLAREAYGATGPEFAAAAMARPEGGAAPGGPAGGSAVAPAVAAGGGPGLAIVRISWLFGPPGADFPHKILAAARRARDERRALDLVADEFASPTAAVDLAAAIVRLAEVAWSRGGAAIGGIHHIVNSGYASRAEWAREVLLRAGVEVPTRDVPQSDYPRPSTPPAWGVMAPTPLPGGPLRGWREATAEYVGQITKEERS